MSTYTPIASITLASAASSVTFSGIPQTYTDLVLVADGNVSSGDIRIRYNGDSGSNYSYTRVYGSGSSASSDRGSSQTDSFITIGGFTNANSIVHLQNYSNTTTFKTALVRTNNPGSYVGSYVLLWRSTSAITGIELFVTGGGTISSGTTFNLYGIANASITNVAKATGGDSVYTDGTYWYHIFRSSGTFTPTQALTADYLVVAGGGGGGTNRGGGGGAGGMRCTVTATGGGGSLESALSLTAQAYTVTVGAGGTGGTSSGNKGSNGSNSVFATITSTGGGGGAGNIGNSAGNSGGSGGGGGIVTSGAGGAGTANQGYAGGTGSANGGAGGGGGAGATGSATTTNAGGNGGNGVATSISGSSVTYAGGGGGGGHSTSAGGTGGTGGGGAGGGQSNWPGTKNGTANTGSGGGGSGEFQDTDGGDGGSGIVIIRYSAAA